MTTFNKVKEAYLSALTTFESEQLQSTEQRLMLILSRLYELFDAEEYFHIPVDGEIARPEPLDAIFTAVHSSLVEATTALGALDTRVSILQAGISTNELDYIVESLRLKVQERLMRTGNGAVSFIDKILEQPLTLTPTNVEILPFSTVKIPNVLTFPTLMLGKIQNIQSTSVIPLTENNVSIPNVAGLQLQFAKRNKDLSVIDLQVGMTESQPVVQEPLELEPKLTYMADTYVDGILRIVATLETPSLISLISTPIPESIYCSVELNTMEGQTLVYPNVEQLIFVDNPSSMIQSIVWNISTDSITAEAFGGVYEGWLFTIGAQAGGRVTYAQLTDVILNTLGSMT